MKYTNPDFKNLDRNYQDFLGSSENFIKKQLKRDKKLWEYYDRLEKALKENQELKQDNEEKGRIIENLKEDMEALKLQLETINHPKKNGTN
tara:strand:- start:213 stop:485 length:273 start_codon:yes stop_codon:yes gene_type:complete